MQGETEHASFGAGIMTRSLSPASAAAWIHHDPSQLSRCSVAEFEHFDGDMYERTRVYHESTPRTTLTIPENAGKPAWGVSWASS